MTPTFARIAAACVFGLLASWPQHAQAANDSIANAWTGVLGQVRAQALGGDGGGSDVAYYRFSLQANRSYAAILWFVGLDGSGLNVNTVSWRDGSDVSVGIGGDLEPFDLTNFIGDIAIYLPSTAGTFYVRIDNPNAAAVTANLMVIETTLFSPWFFVSTGGGYEAFVEIRNNTSENISFAVRAYSAAGAILGASAAVLAPNGNTAVRVGGDLGVMNTGGSVTIVHSGPPGALVANITTLSATTGLSFDAPFAPRMVWTNFQQ